MNNKHISLKMLGVFVILLLGVMGCQPAATDQPQTDATPTTEVQTAQSENPTGEQNEPIKVNSALLLDPAVTEDPDSLLVSQYLYEGLVRLDENGEVQPGLAESWVLSDDQLDYIFELRPNLKFSNGSEITADIIVENFNRWFDPNSSLHADGNFPTWKKIFLGFNGERDAENRAVSQVDGVQKVDENTVIIHLNRLEPEMLNYLAQPAFAILDTTALATEGYGKQGSEIIASGQYMIGSWDDNGIKLVSNPNYWSPQAGEVNFIWK